MLEWIKTTSENEDFGKLVRELDADLRIRDGEEHAFYAQFNKTASIKHVIVAYDQNIAVGCGAIKVFSEDTMEVKRMYVLPERRGEGIASIILAALEEWCKSLGYYRCVLETGKKQPEAIRLYQKNGYHLIPNYGQYLNVENSVCFEKRIL
ncbi:MAG: GNAT family N-acetyltransferase [Bacteroidia bacterium]|nr:GNAT family N-acetyltransferase [Bacteroidia bacterium]